MYLNYYGFHSEPFHVTPDHERLFPSETHREALAALVYGVQQRKGFIALTGEVGLGKTTVLRAFLDCIDREGLKVIYLMNPALEFDDLLDSLFDELDLGERPANSAEAIRALFEHLIECYRRNEGVALVIDEAQTVPVQTLERLRLLSNLETADAKLLQIVLAGQPELDALLSEDRLRQLNQRIAVRVRLRPLTEAESIEYIRHRIEQSADHDEMVIAPRAQKAIAHAAEGVPRLLNVLCDNAFITGYGYGKRPVDLAVAREVIEDNRVMAVHPHRQPPRRRYGRVAATAAGLATIMLAAAYVLLQTGVLDWNLGERFKQARVTAPSSDLRETAEDAAVELDRLEERITSTRELLDRLRELREPNEAISAAAAPGAAADGGAQASSVAESSEDWGELEAVEVAEVALPPTAAGGEAAPPPAQVPGAALASDAAPVSSAAVEGQRTSLETIAAQSNEPVAELPLQLGPVSQVGVALPQPLVPRNLSRAEGGYVVRTVRTGENLWKMIAAVYGEATPERLQEVVAANPGLRDIDTIVPGQQIFFPGAVLTASTETAQGD